MKAQVDLKENKWRSTPLNPANANPMHRGWLYSCIKKLDSMCVYRLEIFIVICLCVPYLCVNISVFLWYIHMHLYIKIFFINTNSGILSSVHLHTYKVIHGVWADQWSVSTRGEMTSSGAFFSSLFCLGCFERMTKQCWRLWICLSVNGWWLGAAQPSPKVIDWGGRSSHLMPGFDSESLPSLLLGNLS